MWKIKTFKTKKTMAQFIKRHNIVWNEIFLNNIAYAIEYKPLKKL